MTTVIDDGGDGGDDEQAPVLITVQADTSPTADAALVALRTATARAEASTGTLQVNVLLCPGAADDVTDWAAECAEPVADARFDIEAKDGLLTAGTATWTPTRRAWSAWTSCRWAGTVSTRSTRTGAMPSRTTSTRTATC